MDAADGGMEMSDTFWLIERGPNEGVAQHQWWNEGPDGRVMGWKSSVHEATHYPTKEQAERVVRANRGLSALPTAITSHSFMDEQDCGDDGFYCGDPECDACVPPPSASGVHGGGNGR
jgi:hypothetical protein